MNAPLPSRLEVLRDGHRRLAEVLPEVRRLGWLVLIGSLAGIVTVAGLLIGLAVSRHVPGGAVLMQGLFLYAAGLSMYTGFWKHRAAYRQRYGREAYRYLFFHFLVPFLATVHVALYFPMVLDGPRVLPPL